MLMTPSAFHRCGARECLCQHPVPALAWRYEGRQRLCRVTLRAAAVVAYHV